MSELRAAIDQIDIEDWITHLGVDYRPTSGNSGPQLNLRECPRCGGTGWKVFLNSETGLGNCFHGGCVGLPGFSLFSITEHVTGNTQKQVAQDFMLYAKDLGWRPKRPERPRAAAPTSVQLPDNVSLGLKNNIDYLSQRDIDGSLAQLFDLRMGQGKYNYVDWDGKARSQSYEQRVIIPIHDHHGNLVTFQGRDISGTAERKYLFPPMLPGTGRYLFNAHRAKGKSRLVMGEGVFDVISLHRAFSGHEDVGAIGSFGISFSAGKQAQDDQLKSLAHLARSGATEVTIMWDSQPTAVIAACNAVDAILRAVPTVNIALLPEGCDPNEVSPEVVRAAFVRAIPATRSNLLKLRLKYGN